MLDIAQRNEDLSWRDPHAHKMCFITDINGYCMRIKKGSCSLKNKFINKYAIEYLCCSFTNVDNNKRLNISNITRSNNKFYIKNSSHK